MHDIAAHLTECFAATFADLPPEEIPNAHVAMVDGWDSLSTMTLLSVVEEEFDIRVPPEDILRFTSYSSILEYLQEWNGIRRGETVGSQGSSQT